MRPEVTVVTVAIEYTDDEGQARVVHAQHRQPVTEDTLEDSATAAGYHAWRLAEANVTQLRRMQVVADVG